MKLAIIAIGLSVTIASWPQQAIAQFGLDRSDFFERGTEQMEREIERLESPVREPILTINERPLIWKQFLFAEAGFSIKMPLGNITSSTEVLETATGNIELQVLATNPRSSRFIVAYSDRLNGAQLENPETILAQVRKLMSPNTEFELQGDRPLDNYPVASREISLKNSSETITFRIYILNQRLYILGSTQPLSEQHSEKLFTFFNSFQLTNNPSPITTDN